MEGLCSVWDGMRPSCQVNDGLGDGKREVLSLMLFKLCTMTSHINNSRVSKIKIIRHHGNNKFYTNDELEIYNSIYIVYTIQEIMSNHMCCHE